VFPDLIYTILHVIVAVYGTVSFIKKEYVRFIIAILFVLLSGFGFLTSPLLKTQDIAMIMCLICGISELAKGENIFGFLNDPIAKIIYVLLGYYTIVALFTVVLGRETLLNAIKIWRLELFYVSYFIFRRIPLQFTEKAFKIILRISALAGIFYLLQFIGITGILVGDIERALAEGGKIIRFRNIPALTVFFFFYLFYINEKITFRYLYLMLFGSILILFQSRGEIIAVTITFIVYQITIKQTKKLIQIGLLLSIIGVMFYPVLQYRFVSKQGSGQNVGFIQGIEQGLTIASRSTQTNNITNTFVLRMALVTERINFLRKHSKYLLMGVGTIHEDSPNNRFNFMINSDRINERGQLIHQQIDTSDIAFLAHTFRYGLIYLILYFILIYQMFKRLFQGRKLSIVSVAGYLLLFKMTLQALGSDQYSTFAQMAVLLLILANVNVNSNTLLHNDSISTNKKK
jgi:hypothetical protein